MERELADRNNREGMKGWLNPSRYGWERVSYWLQRLTGVGLLAYFIGHIYETSQITGGPAIWEAFLELTQAPWSYDTNRRNRHVRLSFSKRNPPNICSWRQRAWQARQARLPL